MIILGIDPGLATMGYGMIRTQASGIEMIDNGVLITPPDLSAPARLNQIYTGVEQILEQYRPDAVAVEELFFNTNVSTAIMVAQARGVAVLACIRYTDRLYEYTPLQIKQAVAGYGKAQKAQVQKMVKTILHLPAPPKPDDAADALAVAICHAQSGGALSEFFRIR